MYAMWSSWRGIAKQITEGKHIINIVSIFMIQDIPALVIFFLNITDIVVPWPIMIFSVRCRIDSSQRINSVCKIFYIVVRKTLSLTNFISSRSITLIRADGYVVINI